MPSTIETFEGPQGPQIEFQISDAPPTPRLLMISESESEALQIQEDMFGYSWRKLTAEHEYPRYKAIRKGFGDELAKFQEFLSDLELRSLSPIQCEVTYVNVILPEGVWNSHSDLGKIIPSATPRLTEGFLPLPEETSYTSQYVIPGENGTPRGRLYVSIEPGHLLPDKTPMYLMKLTARGAPQGDGTSGIIKTMDLGHEWIVQGFATLTSREMHSAWRRRYDNNTDQTDSGCA